MDTRAKILEFDAAIRTIRDLHERQASIRFVTGYFDVLLAGHVTQLRAVKESTPACRLLAVIAQPPDPILSLRARAELVAALAMVDYVVTAEPDQMDQLIAALGDYEPVRLEEADEQRVRQLIEHVHRRKTG